MMTFELRDFEGEEREQFESLLNEIVESGSLFPPGHLENWCEKRGGNGIYTFSLQYRDGSFKGELKKHFISNIIEPRLVVAKADIKFFEDGIPLVYKFFTFEKTVVEVMTLLAHSEENALEEVMEAGDETWYPIRESNVEMVKVNG